MIIQIDVPDYSFYKRELPNGNIRYTGRWAGIAYTIDSDMNFTQKELFHVMENSGVDYVLSKEGYIMNLYTK